MKKIIYSFLCAIFFISAYANDNGNVILNNKNIDKLVISDSIQFQLITNGNGIVSTGVLTAADPNNTELIIDKWAFSDTTNGFVIYVRDVTKKQTEFVQCTDFIAYQNQQPIIKINGWSNGLTVGCNVQ